MSMVMDALTKANAGKIAELEKLVADLKERVATLEAALARPPQRQRPSTLTV